MYKKLLQINKETTDKDVNERENPNGQQPAQKFWPLQGNST